MYNPFTWLPLLDHFQDTHALSLGEALEGFAMREMNVRFLQEAEQTSKEDRVESNSIKGRVLTPPKPI